MSALRRNAWLALALLVVAGAIGLILYGWEWERVEIEAERSRRLAYVASGMRLPGTPDLEDFKGRLAAHGLAHGAPVFIRIFKREFELELWMKRDGRFHRFAVYPICRWSGGLGPKLAEGDWQAPEGFYTVDASALNPNSRWHRSFNLGFPNALDRAHGRTGSYLMVHGGCGSIGCFAMTDAGDRRGLARGDRRPETGPGPLPRAHLPISHGGGEPRPARKCAVGNLLARFEVGLRRLRSLTAAAQDHRL
jgi:hypothetical protein